MKPVIYHLAIVMLLCSCKKEMAFDNFPVTLYASEITRTSDVRLFVGKAQITDNKVIDKFIGSEAEYFERPTDMDVKQSDESIIFHSKDSVTFGTESYKFYVEKNVEQFLFYSSFLSPSDEQRQMLLKYKDDLVSVPSYSGFTFRTKEVRVGYGSYTNLELCFMAYKLSKNTLSPWEDNTIILHYEEAGTSLNEFNEKAINTLQPLDTLAVREYRIGFVTKK